MSSRPAEVQALEGRTALVAVEPVCAACDRVATGWCYLDHDAAVLLCRLHSLRLAMGAMAAPRGMA